ncbi:MAG: hypothetical protein ACPG77_01665, partial [Nannocystaceae bacterium]
FNGSADARHTTRPNDLAEAVRIDSSGPVPCQTSYAHAEDAFYHLSAGSPQASRSSLELELPVVFR